MSDKWLISRRTVLRGIGASVALPLLDCMIPNLAGSVASAAAAVGKPPVRMAFRRDIVVSDTIFSHAAQAGP